MSETTSGDRGWRDLPQEGRKVSPMLIGAIVIAIVLLVFIFQNTDDTEITWLFFDANTALWLVILVSAVAGYLIGQLVEMSIRRRRRLRDRN